MKTYSLRKSRRILRSSYKMFQRKKHILSESKRADLESDLRALDRALLEKNKKESSQLAHKVDTTIHKYLPKTNLDHVREVVYALAFAIVVAFLIRQFWFELYEVPTGSMRPTIEELDRLVVSKSTFGINLPFRKKSFLYSDDYLRRAGIIVFTVEGMDVADADMLYFKLIPGKKRFIKRCVALPGDTIYFYGGRIYGIDRDGKPLLEQADATFLQNIGIERIDHVPYIALDGKPLLSNPIGQNAFSSVTMHQMNLPVAQLEFKGKGVSEGTFFNGKEWVADQVAALKEPREIPMSYSDLWGIGNYAMARLLTLDQVRQFYGQAPDSQEAVLYLELRHTPNLTYPKPELRQGEVGFIQPMMTPFATVIPLQQHHLDTLQKNLFTARFFIANGKAYRYQEGRSRPQRVEYDPKFPGVPDGCYEFYYGKGYKVHLAGVTTALPPDHPLYRSSPDNILKLFNVGIAFNKVFDPMAANQPYNPQRFAFFREGDLYVMGTPLLKKDDPTLTRFTQNELEKQSKSSRDKPYIAFVDHGPPLKNGQLDVDFIRAFGLKVPDDSVVALGDNYAMSADSRDFGFVPTENLRGSPCFIFWPFSKRLGSLPQVSYAWFTLPNVIVWALAIVIIGGSIIWIIRRNQQSIFDDEK